MVPPQNVEEPCVDARPCLSGLQSKEREVLRLEAYWLQRSGKRG